MSIYSNKGRAKDIYDMIIENYTLDELESLDRALYRRESSIKSFHPLRK